MNGKRIRGRRRALGALVLGFAGLVLMAGCTSAPAPGIRVDSAKPASSATMRPYTIRGKTYTPRMPKTGYSEVGMASWYGPESGRKTANGERYDPEGLSAAHRTLPLPSVAEVTNLDNGKSIRVRVNDRGPFNDRVIDLSRGAARALGVLQTGTAKVRVTWQGLANGSPLASTPEAEPDSATPHGAYIVQLGAFSVKSNAEAVQARMNGARLSRRGNLYLVYLGPYDDPGSAEVQRQDAIRAGFASAILKRQD